MARKRPEEDLHAAFYDGAPGDYGTTRGTSRQSIRDILAEEVNQRARTGTVDTAEMDPVPEQDLGEPAETQEETLRRERRERIESREPLKEIKPWPDSKDFKEWKPIKMRKAKPKKKAKPKSDKTPIRKPLKKKKTETQVAQAKKPPKKTPRQLTEAEKKAKKAKASGKTYRKRPADFRDWPKRKQMDWFRKYFDKY